MSRRVARYRHHKPSNRGVVQWKPLFGNKVHYLPGEYESDEMMAAWGELLQQIAATEPPKFAPPKAVKTINGLCAAYLTFIRPRKSEGFIDNVERCTAPLTSLYGKTAVDAFGPLALIEVRSTMETSGTLCRSTINSRISKIKTMFRWGVSREIVHPETHAKLSLVEPLREGETAAGEREKVTATTWAAVSRVLPFLSPTVAAMVRVHYLAGMRSDEITGLRKREIDFGGAEWVYRKSRHKTSKLGKEKVVVFGPQAQAILKPYLANGDAFVFSPARALEELAQIRAANRKTPKYGKQKIREPVARKTNPRYTTRHYFKAIRYGFEQLAKSIGYKIKRAKRQPFREWIEASGVEYWHPHQLRHARAMETQAAFGLEGVRAQTGNTITAAQIYAQQSLDLAKRIARETG